VARTITGRWAFVANLPCYAAGLQFAADADGGDGLLDVCTFSGGSLWDGLRYLSYVLLGKHQELDDCCMATGSRLRIEADGPVPYQLDGDPGGMLPLEIEILPRRLNLVLPKTSPLAQAPALRLRAVNS
jgi:diacylglycerol kinase family enzyme